MKAFVGLALVASLFVVGCGGSETGGGEAAATVVNPQQLLLDSIAGLEAQLIQAENITEMRKEAFAVLATYKQFAAQFPQHERTPEFLFRGGDVANGLKQYNVALSMYEQIYQDYPDFDKRDVALFLVAFIYDAHLGEYDKAREYYEKVIAEFPGTRSATDAEATLPVLGMSEEELIQYLESKNAPQ